MFVNAVMKFRYDNKNHVIPSDVSESIDEIPACAGMTQI